LHDHSENVAYISDHNFWLGFLVAFLSLKLLLWARDKIQNGKGKKCAGGLVPTSSSTMEPSQLELKV
jgi:hypothetical protein